MYKNYKFSYFERIVDGSPIKVKEATPIESCEDIPNWIFNYNNT